MIRACGTSRPIPSSRRSSTGSTSFVREEVEPLDLVLGDPYDKTDERAHGDRCGRCSSRCKDQGLWAVPPRPRARRPGLRPGEAGAAERDARPLAAGRRRCSAARRPTPATPRSSPTTAPTSRRRKYLQPLLDGDDLVLLLDDRAARRRRPDAVHDPRRAATATSGSSTARSGSRPTPATPASSSSWRSPNPDVSAYQGMSMFIVPAETPGVEIIRNVGVGGEPRGPRHATATSATTDVRVPADHLLGGEGQAFVIAQTRLGGGRIHHAMRTIAHGPQGVRHDVRAGRVARRPATGTLASTADDPGEDRRQLDRDRAVPPARAAHRLADRQAQGLQAGPQGHRRGQGGDAEGATTTSPSGRCTCTARSASRTRCRSSG